MEDEEFLGSLTSALIGEEREPAVRETLFQKVTRLGPDVTRAELAPLIDYYDTLSGYLPEANDFADALVELSEKLDADSCARLEELYERQAETVRAELRHLEVRVTYSPWVDALKSSLQAFVRGERPRAPILEALADLENQFDLSYAKNRASVQAMGTNADDTTRKVFALSEQGYAGGHRASRALTVALEGRDIAAVGEALRALNEAFSQLTQAKELCELYSRTEA